MAIVKYLSAGSDETQDTTPLGTTSGTVTSDATVSNTGTRSFKFDSTASNVAAFGTRAGVLTQAGSRISFWFRMSALPATNPHMAILMTSGAAATCLSLDVNSTGVLAFENATTNFPGTTVLAINTWYRISIAYTITSTTVNELRLYINGALELSKSNTTLANAATADFRIGQSQAFGASKQVWIDDIYIDNDATLTEPGGGVPNALRVTVKLPAALGSSNTFDTLVGSGTNRWNYVSERPFSQTNEIKHAATSLAAENFGIQSVSAGDVDISAANIVGYIAYVQALVSTVTGLGTYAITCNGVDTAIVLTASAVLYYSAGVLSSVYPSNAAGVGLKNTGTATAPDTIFVDGGMLICYTPIFPLPLSTPQRAASVMPHYRM